jgi:large subunit ribosomal protein L15
MIKMNKIDPKKTINSEALLEIGVIKKMSAKVKILAKGVIKSKINIEVSAVSSKAKEIIEQLGGSVTLIEKKKPENKKVKKSEV